MLWPSPWTPILIAPLAFLSPRIIAAIVDGTAPGDLTVTGLAKALPYSWAAQEREAQGERHIRLLAPLVFLSPRIIAAIADGTAPGDLTVTDLAKALPYSWAAQEETIGLLIVAPAINAGVIGRGDAIA